MKLEYQASICFTTSGIGSLGPSPCKQPPALIQMHPAHTTQLDADLLSAQRTQIDKNSRCQVDFLACVKIMCPMSHPPSSVHTQQPAEPLAKAAHGTPNHCQLELSINPYQSKCSKQNIQATYGRAAKHEMGSSCC